MKRTIADFLFEEGWPLLILTSKKFCHDFVFRISIGMITDSWIWNLLTNIITYGSLVLPVYIGYLWLRKYGYITRAGSLTGFLFVLLGCLLFPFLSVYYYKKKCLFAPSETAVTNDSLRSRPLITRLVALFFIEKPSDPSIPTSNSSSKPTTISESQQQQQPWYKSKDTTMLMYCFAGLMSMYLTWGLMQEKIMTQEYRRIQRQEASAESDRFRDSQFLVFVNRLSAFILAGSLIIAKDYPKHRTPLYKYSYASLSNVMSSWCQYEALKHIIFPLQVLGKTFKIVPVMIMSKFVSNVSYPSHEYFTSFLISLGCGIFLITQGGSSNKVGDAVDISGLILMTGYVIFDSFTSNWQSELKQRYNCHKIHLMCSVNFFSSILTFYSLILQGTFGASLSFALTHEGILFDLLLLALCGAIGQLFIFETITRFGPVTFTILMNIRQTTAIFLSALYFGHRLTAFGVCGIFIVAAAVLSKPYLARRYGGATKKQSTPPSAITKSPVLLTSPTRITQKI